MTATHFDLGLRLKAHTLNSRVRRTSTARIAIDPNAMLIAIITAPGDHSGLWAVGTGTTRGKPSIASAADPRLWSSQSELWDKLGNTWAGWIADHTSNNTLPQFVVANTQAADRLYASALLIARSDKTSANAQRAARAFVIAHHNARAAGQQSLVKLTEVFTEHFITPFDPLDERHLGHWLGHPVRTGDWQQPDVALPDGADASTTPLGKAWDRMNRHANGLSRVDVSQIHGQAITLHTSKEITARFTRLREAVQLLSAHLPAPLPLCAVNAAQEAAEHTYYQTQERTPSDWSIRAQWRTLGHREKRASQWQEALYANDALERARGAASGDVLVASRLEGQGARFVSSQQQVRVRPGDALRVDCDGLIVDAKVESLFVHDDGRVGVQLDLGGAASTISAWPADQSIRTPTPAKLPWTHDREGVALSFPDVEGNLLATLKRPSA